MLLNRFIGSVCDPLEDVSCSGVKSNFRGQKSPRIASGSDLIDIMSTQASGSRMITMKKLITA